MPSSISLYNRLNDLASSNKKFVYSLVGGATDKASTKVGALYLLVSLHTTDEMSKILLNGSN